MTRNLKLGSIALLLLALSLGSGCGYLQSHREPPLQVIPDMDDQAKYKAQAENKFFADGRASRLPVAGTIAQGQWQEDENFLTGKQGEQWLQANPLPITTEVLRRGQERYNIYCASCHDRVGTGQGMVVLKGFPPAANLHDERLRAMADGQVFDVISHGIRNMPGLKHQIPAADRWAIVRYVRALQRSQSGTLQDVPAELRDSLR